VACAFKVLYEWKNVRARLGRWRAIIVCLGYVSILLDAVVDTTDDGGSLPLKYAFFTSEPEKIEVIVKDAVSMLLKRFWLGLG
jgi:predicted secreted protein